MADQTRAKSPRAHRHRRAAGLVVRATAATAAVQLLASTASALDLDSDGGLITDTIASRERLKDWDLSKKFGAERVTERDRGYAQPDGVRAGNYFIFPSIGTAVVFDDNIYSSDKNKVSDFRHELTPHVRFQSHLPRHVLDLSIDGKIVNYFENSSQDYGSVRAQLDGALHFDHAHTLSVSAFSALEHEERGEITSPRAADAPVEFHHHRVLAGLTRDVGRLYGTISAGFEQWDYRDATSNVPGPLDQDHRDLDVLSTQLKLGYRASPGYEIIAKLKALKQWNQGDGVTDYDAIGYEAMAGVAFETNPLLRWRLLGGYGLRDYEQASIDNVATSLLEGRVQWLATQRMTINASASRAILDRQGSEVGGRVESKLQGRVDYELYHNIILNVSAELKDSDFIGATRQDRSWSAKIGIDYYLSKNWLFTFGYEHLRRDSSDDDFDVTRNRFTIGAKLQF